MRVLLLVAAVAAAEAKSLPVSCDMSGYSLNMGALYFYNDSALCEATCKSCLYGDGQPLSCGGFGAAGSNLTKCYAPDAAASSTVAKSVNISCDDVSNGLVRFELAGNAMNDDVTDDEEFCFGGCPACDKPLRNCRAYELLVGWDTANERCPLH